jgi:hypothetical protein
VPWRVARDTSAERWNELGLLPPRVVPLNAFAYLLSLGFRPASLLPAGAAPAIIAADRVMRPLAPLTALRALLTWETTSPSHDNHESSPSPRRAKDGGGRQPELD